MRFFFIILLSVSTICSNACYANDNEAYISSNSVKEINPDAPQFVKDILANKNKIPLDVSVGHEPNNPYQTLFPGGYLGSTSIEGIQEKPSFLETAKTQAYRMNATAQGINALDTQLEQTDPTFYDKPDGWTSKTDTKKFVNIRPQYMKAMLDAKSPKHQDQILRKIYEEQKADDDIANGSWLAWLVGGAAGIATNPLCWLIFLIVLHVFKKVTK